MDSGSQTLKDAINEAIRDWVTGCISIFWPGRTLSGGPLLLRAVVEGAANDLKCTRVTHVRTAHYLLGSALGPHPFPTIVRNSQSVIGRKSSNRPGSCPMPASLASAAGSNATGLFHPLTARLYPFAWVLALARPSRRARSGNW
ncbi:MAG: hypothetical protein NZM11_05880, partial [Anaerolineales bacterium]|nr:hypothetical protein [Anaerolineales bacterium]